MFVKPKNLESILDFFWNLPWNMSWIMSCWKKKIKNHGLPEFSSDPPLGGGPDANSGRPCTLIHSPPCRTPCRLFIHELSFGPLGLHLLVWSELGRSPPFQPMRALTLPWSRAFNLVCEVALSPKNNQLKFTAPRIILEGFAESISNY